MKVETTLEDYKRGIVEFIEKRAETEDEDEREDLLSEAISLANRLADFDHKYMGARLGDMYREFKAQIEKGEL